MARFIIVVFLIISCAVIFGGMHVMASHPSQSLDMEEFFSFGWNAAAGLLCVGVAILTVSWIYQIQHGAQFILSFFLYAWRNSYYGRADRRFTGLFSSLETGISF
jgi:hypothetical protein